MLPKQPLMDANASFRTVPAMAGGHAEPKPVLPANRPQPVVIADQLPSVQFRRR
jgi:hypothetical protein